MPSGHDAKWARWTIRVAAQVDGGSVWMRKALDEIHSGDSEGKFDFQRWAFYPERFAEDLPTEEALTLAKAWWRHRLDRTVPDPVRFGQAAGR